MAESIPILFMGLLLVVMNLLWYRECQKVNDDWLALLKQQTEDWVNHCTYINSEWSERCNELIKELEQCGAKMDGVSDE